MLAAKAKEQEDEILSYEEKKKLDQSLEEEIELYQKQVESIKEELKVLKTFSDPGETDVYLASDII